MRRSKVFPISMKLFALPAAILLAASSARAADEKVTYQDHALPWFRNNMPALKYDRVIPCIE